MSYYAKGAGEISINLPEEDDVRSLLDKLEAIQEYSYVSPDIEDKNAPLTDIIAFNISELLEISRIFTDFETNTINIMGFFPMGSWNEDEYTGALKAIEPYCTQGLIEFDGDEDCHWRYIFDGDTWLDQNGTITYDEPTPEDKGKYVTVGDILEIIDENENVAIIQDGKSVSEYDGKNSIDEVYNNRNVYKIYTSVDGILGKPVICIEIA